MARLEVTSRYKKVSTNLYKKLLNFYSAQNKFVKLAIGVILLLILASPFENAMLHTLFNHAAPSLSTLEQQKQFDKQATIGLLQAKAELIKAKKNEKFAKIAFMKNLSQQRKDELLPLMSKDPQAFLNIALSNNAERDMPSEILDNIEKEVTMEGDLQVISIDSRTGENNTQQSENYSLKLDNGNMITLLFVNSKPDGITGRVRVHGILLDHQMVINNAFGKNVTALSTSEQKVHAGTAGPVGYAIILYNFGGNGLKLPASITNSQVHNDFFVGSGSVNAYYVKNSYGTASITGEVYGPYTITSTGTDGCKWNTDWKTQADALADAQGAGRYGHRFYIAPPSSCVPGSNGGLGLTPGSLALASGDYGPNVYAHEVGHNFGAFHAHIYHCPGGVYSSSCTESTDGLNDPGDSYDVMEPHANNFNPLNAIHRMQMGWLSLTSGNGTMQLTTIGAYQGTRGLVVPYGQGLAHYVEYRQELGGMLIHDTYCDVTCNSTKLFGGVFGVGQSFVDSQNNIKVTLDSASGSTASVTVSGANPPCKRFPPKLLYNGSAQYGQAGETIGFPFSLQNADTGDCPSEQFVFTFGGLPGGWTVSPNTGPAPIQWTTGYLKPQEVDNSLVFYVTSPNTAAAQTVTLGERATRKTDSQYYSGVAPAQYIIATAPQPTPTTPVITHTPFATSTPSYAGSCYCSSGNPSTNSCASGYHCDCFAGGYTGSGSCVAPTPTPACSPNTCSFSGGAQNCNGCSSGYTCTNPGGGFTGIVSCVSGSATATPKPTATSYPTPTPKPPCPTDSTHSCTATTGSICAANGGTPDNNYSCAVGGQCCVFPPGPTAAPTSTPQPVPPTPTPTSKPACPNNASLSCTATTGSICAANGGTPNNNYSCPSGSQCCNFPSTPTATPPPAGVNGASCGSNTIPTNMTTGQTYTVSQTMINSGTSTWIAPSAGGVYQLGSQDPQDNQTWGLGRVPLGINVPPGGSYTFTFQETAPSAPGSYQNHWAMVQENVAWIIPSGGSCGQTVSVSAPPPACPYTCTATSGNICIANGGGIVSGYTCASGSQCCYFPPAPTPTSVPTATPTSLPANCPYTCTASSSCQANSGTQYSQYSCAFAGGGVCCIFSGGPIINTPVPTSAGPACSFNTCTISSGVVTCNNCSAGTGCSNPGNGYTGTTSCSTSIGNATPTPQPVTSCQYSCVGSGLCAANGGTTQAGSCGTGGECCYFPPAPTSTPVPTPVSTANCASIGGYCATSGFCAANFGTIIGGSNLCPQPGNGGLNYCCQ